MSDWDEMLAQAEARAKGDGGDWGERIRLDPGETFKGRFRGEELDRTWGDEARVIYLLWDEHDRPCFMRHATALGREMEQAAPTIGMRIAIHRGEDRALDGDRVMHRYGVVAMACNDPLPDETSVESGIPF